MATPEPFNKQPATTNAKGVKLPVQAHKVDKGLIDRKAQAERLKAQHSVTFEELSKR